VALVRCCVILVRKETFQSVSVLNIRILIDLFSNSTTNYHPQPTGKTTFLNDTTKSHKCTYIRQYHNIRPYVTVSKIPNFDPTKLPYWDIYEKEGKAESIKVGGTMAGEFTGMCDISRSCYSLVLLFVAD
jgi:hypothetical protein